MKKKNTKIIMFSKNRLPFSGFSTIATAVDLDLRYITEESTQGDKLKSMHESFEIDVEMFRSIMKEWSKGKVTNYN